MKRTTGPTVIVVLSLLCGVVHVNAQPYRISWFTADAGGGTSRGGSYSISSTIGQPDAGQMAGGSYNISGGFWSAAAAIQTEGAPFLQISGAGSSIVLNWPFPSTGFVLEETTALMSPTSATLWTDVTSSSAFRVGSNWTVTIPSTARSRLFRLRKT